MQYVLIGFKVTGDFEVTIFNKSGFECGEKCGDAATEKRLFLQDLYLR